jgi:hypothetical protein
MEFDLATITGIALLGLIIVFIIIWILSSGEEEEFPKRRRWRYE